MQSATMVVQAQRAKDPKYGYSHNSESSLRRRSEHHPGCWRAHGSGAPRDVRRDQRSDDRPKTLPVDSWRGPRRKQPVWHRTEASVTLWCPESDRVFGHGSQQTADGGMRGRGSWQAAQKAPEQRHTGALRPRRSEPTRRRGGRPGQRGPGSRVPPKVGQQLDRQKPLVRQQPAVEVGTQRMPLEMIMQPHLSEARQLHVSAGLDASQIARLQTRTGGAGAVTPRLGGACPPPPPAVGASSSAVSQGSPRSPAAGRREPADGRSKAVIHAVNKRSGFVGGQRR